MPFKNIADCEKRTVLTTALLEYCGENGIDPSSAEYDDARSLMVLLFENGHRSVADLKAALVAAIRRDQ